MEKILGINKIDDIDKYSFFDGFLIEVGYSFFSICNLNHDEALSLINCLHEKGKKVYLRFDKIVLESELNLFNDLIDVIKLADGVFFEDFAFVLLFKEHAIKTKLIYAPYDSVGEKDDIEVLFDNGVDKILVPKGKEYLFEDNNKFGICLLYKEILFTSRRKLFSLYNGSNNIILDKKKYKISEKTRTSFQTMIENENGSSLINEIKKVNIEVSNGFVLFDALLFDESEKEQYLLGDNLL